MPPESAAATPPGADQSAIPAAAQAPAPAPAQPSPDPDNPGGFTAADFADPNIGPKLKNWQKGWQETREEAKRHKTRAEELSTHEQVVKNVNAIMGRYPKLRQQILDAHAGKYQEGQEAQPAPEDETPEQRMRRELREEITGQLRSEMALQGLHLSLGKGDLEAGQKAYGEKAAHLNAILSTLNNGSPQEKLSLAWKLANLSSAPSPAPAAPPPPPPPPGSIASETGHGSPAPEGAEDWSKMTSDERYAATMRSAGFGNIAAYMDASGAFGR